MQRIKFTPKARLIKILGEQLIKDATVGIIELVKNSYDADATQVEITIQSINSPDAKIIIKDNGFGMDSETFINKWMNPATGHKEEQKENKVRTKLGRLPLGEKGVGRFASQQIGNHLKMTSKINSSEQELFVEIDWTKFDGKEVNLEDVTIDYEMRVSKYFRNNESGTILEISKLKSSYLEPEIEKISNSLQRMKSPFKGATDFNVHLVFKDCPEVFNKYSDLGKNDNVREKAPYTFVALIGDDGTIDYEYEFKMPGFRKRKISDKENVYTSTGSKNENNIQIGEFLLYLHAYDKRRDKLKLSNIRREDLSNWGGVSVYRDGIRVFPYGEKGNDWLNLDNRRIQNPSQRIGNDQVVGMVEVNQETNPFLKDKTNREGLIENDHYKTFADLIIRAITVFEGIQYEDRQLVNPPKQKTSNEKLDETVSNVTSNLEQIKKKVQETDNKAGEVAEPLLNKVGEQVSELKQQITDTIDELEKDKKILFNLAGTGLAAERFTHEFARLINGALSSLERLKRRIDLNDGKTKKEVDTISSALEVLRNDIRLLGPMFYIKKTALEKELKIREIIHNTLSLQEQFLKKENIEISISEEGAFKVMMREGSCMQIFNNLIDNAIFWCSRKSESDKKRIKILIDEKNKSVYITDSGPGVATRYKEKIFDPFFSMKSEDGRGLGLYIVKEILDEKNFGIFLVSEEDYPGLLSGASFKVVFNDNKE